MPFETFSKKANTTLLERSLSINELKEAFFSLKVNQRPGAGKITFGVTKNCFEELNDILKFIFDLSFQTGILPESFKTAKVTPLFKNGKSTEIITYRPISVLPCFSKILERIMYNRLYKYLLIEKVLYSKQFCFQKGHSIEYTIDQLLDQIYSS